MSINSGILIFKPLICSPWALPAHDDVALDEFDDELDDAALFATAAFKALKAFNNCDCKLLICSRRFSISARYSPLTLGNDFGGGLPEFTCCCRVVVGFGCNRTLVVVVVVEAGGVVVVGGGIVDTKVTSEFVETMSRRSAVPTGNKLESLKLTLGDTGGFRRGLLLVGVLCSDIT